MNCPICEKPNAEGARFCASCGAAFPREGGPGLVGQLLGGRYLVTGVIGEGGMGVVYEAEQRLGETVRKVAIKTLLPELSRDRVVVSRFFRECGTVAQLEHPNTVRIYDFGEAQDGTLYIVMEFVRGRSLGDVINEGSLSPERTTQILRQVCGALEEAHVLGIVHRDLKPDNIVLTKRADENDFVKLLDFGIAAHVGKSAEGRTKLTQQGVVLGTPPYMSPEQLAGKPLDLRSDLYSLGVIAYEMLTGRLPFVAKTAVEWAQKHMLEQPSPPSTIAQTSIPMQAESAVMRALAKDPADRQASAMQFYRELVGDRGSGTDRPSPTAPDMAAVAATVGPQLAPLPDRTVRSPPMIPQFNTGAAVAAPIPPPPVMRRRSRGGGGWLVALGVLATLGSLAAVVGAYVGEIGPFAQNDTPPPFVSATATPTAENTGTSTSIEPAATAPTLPPPVFTPPPTSKPAPQNTGSKPTPKPTASPPPTQPPPPPTQTQPPPPPTQTQPPPPPTQPPPPSGPQGDIACRQAEGLARGGQIEAGVGMYRQCKATGGSAGALDRAFKRIDAQTPDEVRKRANLGDCPGARSAANSASAIGAQKGMSALANTSCR